jgi:hypothetical protein
MKVLTAVFLTISAVFLFSGGAQADLTVIGTATYMDNDYKLIYMEAGPFGPITWLDYTRKQDTWQNQVNWATGLGADLTVTLFPGYTTDNDWLAGWRLPALDESKADQSVRGWKSGHPAGFGYEGPNEDGCYDYWYGYNMVHSEMGYLFYEELGNKGYFATDGKNPQPGWGLSNTGNFSLRPIPNANSPLPILAQGGFG